MVANSAYIVYILTKGTVFMQKNNRGGVSMDYYDKIYYSLIGELDEESALPIVPNLFAPGSACNQAYDRLLQARDRISAKLGWDDDPDLSEILAEMNTIQRILCREIMALRNL